MPGNNRIFVSHTHADNARCEPLLIALDAWRVDYWYDGQQLDAGQELSPRLQQAITQRDILLRVCTTNTSKSYWMNLERSAFNAQQYQQRQKGKRRSQRTSIDLVLDADYSSESAERATVTINAVGRPEAKWMAELAAALGVKLVARREQLSRRAVVGLGAAAAVTVAGLTGGAVIAKSRIDSASAAYPKPQHVPFQFPNPQTFDPHIKWRFAAGSGGSVTAALAQGQLIVQSDDGLYSLNAMDGSIAWWRPGLAGDGSGAPVIVDDTLYVAITGLSGELFALHVADGKTVWNTQSKSSVGDLGLAVSGQALCLITDDSTLAVYNMQDGSLRWISQQKLSTTGILNLKPSVDGSGVYIGDDSGKLTAFNLADGSVRWSTNVGTGFMSSAAVANGVLYGGSNDQNIYAINTTDGSVKWRYSGGAMAYATPTPFGDTLYVTLGNQIGALDIQTGAARWTTPLDDSPITGISGPLAVSGDLIFAPADQYLYAFSAKAQKTLWRVESLPTDTNSLAPLVSGTMAYWPANNGVIYALDTTVNV